MQFKISSKTIGKYNVRYLCVFDCIPSTHSDLIGCQLSLKNLITDSKCVCFSSSYISKLLPRFYIWTSYQASLSYAYKVGRSYPAGIFLGHTLNLEKIYTLLQHGAHYHRRPFWKLLVLGSVSCTLRSTHTSEIYGLNRVL